MSSALVERPSEVVDVGERVWVKVIAIETKDGKEKISLSMKVVHQGTGKDLDSNNVVLEQDERKRREFRDYSKQKITLEAVLNTVCKKCGCKGHFAQDCFSQPGGTKYSLLPEEEEEEDIRSNTQQAADNSTKKKKKEKEKKRKKRQREKQGSSSSDTSENSDSDNSETGPSRKKGKHEEKSRKTAKKKKRKHKKHKHRDPGKGD